MKIRKIRRKNCRIVNCSTKICKDWHKLANYTPFVYIITANFNLQNRQLHYITTREQNIPLDRKPLRNYGEIYVSATPQAGALRHIQMAWPVQRANVSGVPRERKHACKSAPRAALAFLWTEVHNTRKGCKRIMQMHRGVTYIKQPAEPFRQKASI